MAHFGIGLGIGLRDDLLERVDFPDLNFEDLRARFRAMGFASSGGTAGLLFSWVASGSR